MIIIEKTTALNLFAAAEGLNPKKRTEEDNQLLETRIQRLGEIKLEAMAPTNPTSMKTLNPATVKAAAALHKHKFKSYTKEEAESALKFLELTLLYGYYENFDLELTIEGMSGEFNDRDLLVEKALTSAQKVWDHLDTKKITQEALQEEIVRLQKTTKKVLSRRLQQTEQTFFRKQIDKALTILQAFAKQ